MTLVVPTAEAKIKSRVYVGCVQAHNGKYELSTMSKKGKARNYALVGGHDFAKDVGHKVRVSGGFQKRVLTAGSVQTLASKCN